MQYISYFDSPLGKLYLTADDTGLTGLVFEQEEGNILPMDVHDIEFNEDHPVIRETMQWLSKYFAGKNPGNLPPLYLQGSAFRQSVWEIVKAIPYGETMTYGDIAKLITMQRGTLATAQAVGGAVGHNPIPIIVPCHRVLGVGSHLTGYSAGLSKKKFLLDLERIKYVE